MGGVSGLPRLRLILQGYDFGAAGSDLLVSLAVKGQLASEMWAWVMMKKLSLWAETGSCKLSAACGSAARKKKIF